jgi:hypothetical protein
MAQSNQIAWLDISRWLTPPKNSRLCLNSRVQAFIYAGGSMSFPALRFALLSVAMCASMSVWATPGSHVDDPVWIDEPLKNWNEPGMDIPFNRDSGNVAECAGDLRGPRNDDERSLANSGWFLLNKSGEGAYFPTKRVNRTVVIFAAAGFAGQCRIDVQGFVFYDDVFVGTLSPYVVSSRATGALGDVRLSDEKHLEADFAYYDGDALCCPSKRMVISYEISTIASLKGSGHVLRVLRKHLEKALDPDQPPAAVRKPPMKSKEPGVFLPAPARDCLQGSNIYARFSPGVKTVSPSWVSGDFDDDGVKDYAVILSSNDGRPDRVAAIAICRGQSKRAEILGPSAIDDPTNRHPFDAPLKEWHVDKRGLTFFFDGTVVGISWLEVNPGVKKLRGWVIQNR